MIDLQCMYNTRNVTQYREEDVDQEVGIAATLQEDPDWWEDDGEDDFANITVMPRDVSICSCCGRQERMLVRSMRRWIVGCFEEKHQLRISLHNTERHT